MNYYDVETLKKIHENHVVDIEGYNGKLVIVKVRAGEIFLPTGEFAAFDPQRRYKDYLAKKEPFVVKVKPGIYLVNVYLAFGSSGKKIAFSEIEFNSNMPIKYRLALNTVDRYAKVKPGEEFGFTVFSQRASYADVETLKYINNSALSKASTEKSKIGKDCEIDNVTSRLSGRYNDDAFGSVKVNEDKMNLFYFSVMNCNFCPSFWGIDKNGEKCCLITDYMLHK